MSKAKKRVKKLLEDLNNKIDNVQSSEEFKEMLTYMSKFHNYSFNNRILIQLQCPAASMVAGFNKWKELGRYVLPKKERKKKGVRIDPIRILAPGVYNKIIKEVDLSNKEKVKKLKARAQKHKSYKLEEKGNKLILKKRYQYFKYVNVYDLSQTDGDPVPSLDIDMSDDMPTLLEPLKKLTIESGIELEFKRPDQDKNLSAATQGYSCKGKVVINTEKNHLTRQASILIHELGHEELHDIKDRQELSKEIKEMEADAVAYVVMNHYGVKNPSDKYLALYKKAYDLKESLDRISRIANKIIDYCDNYFEKNNVELNISA
ncbi:MAG: ArdC-like ssDNA-binding domain-containing protein [Nanoarchaeota archaeon]